MSRVPNAADRPLPASNAEWLLEIGMLATILDTQFGRYAVGPMAYQIPRAAREKTWTPGALAGALAEGRDDSDNLDLLALAETYLQAHVLMELLSQSEARQIAAYVESNLFPLSNIIVNLQKAQPATRPRAHAPAGAWLQLKVTLRHVAPAVWRRVVVPADLKLPALHTVLQEAMGWTDSHLHQFLLGHLRYAIPHEDDFTPPDGDERKMYVGDLLGAPKDHLIYEYDFGDSWEHEVVVEKVLAEPPPDGRISCLAGKNACPPEDVGGPPGYERMLASLADPGDDEHESYREWLGGSFDPGRFDRAAVNKRLHRIRVPKPRAARLRLVR